MKKLFLILAMLIATSAWAKVEYPIELTCEIGAEILYIDINEDAKDRSLIFYKTNFVGISAYGKSGTKSKIKNFKVLDNGISFTSFYKAQNNLFNINSYTLKISQSTHGFTGQCLKGFKEYDAKLF